MAIIPISYLSDRNFQIRFGDALSAKSNISDGVFQGGILSPVLYNIYSADHPNTTNTQVSKHENYLFIFVVASSTLFWMRLAMPNYYHHNSLRRLESSDPVLFHDISITFPSTKFLQTKSNLYGSCLLLIIRHALPALRIRKLCDIFTETNTFYNIFFERYVNNIINKADFYCFKTLLQHFSQFVHKMNENCCD
ncbi:hypothetical protein AGLY_016258 [Aphis glycines]|uniref:Reverse transcriptase domain-containing protein n=1 Tax=Aphis glycines TaxID=307491 RepID=A0A6G0SY32_APHGL|nr:hypothetical protein AGLY_016258 [Aphis glycines]